MKTGVKVGIGAAIAAVVIGGAAYGISQENVTPPPPTSNYTITMSAQSSGQVGATIPFTVTVLNNGSGVSGISVTLTDSTTGTSSTATTNSSGVAVFDVTFKSAGDYSLYASAVVP